MFLVASGLFSMFYFNTLYLQRVLGYSALEAGSLPPLHGRDHHRGRALPAARAQVRRTRGSARSGWRWRSSDGYFVRLEPGSSYVADFLPGVMLASIGMGLTFVPVTLIATSGIPTDDAGLASGLYNTSQQVGGALGLAILSTFAVEQDRGHGERARARGRAG